MRRYRWQIFIDGYGEDEEEASENAFEALVDIGDLGNPLAWVEVDPDSLEKLDEITHVCS